MSHLTPDGRNVEVTGDKPFNSLVPPQEESRTTNGSTTTSTTDPGRSLIPPQEEKQLRDTGKKPLAQRGVEFIREKAAGLPLDLTSDADADAARDKALADSVRGGFVDDVGVEENRRVLNLEPKSKTE